MPTPVKFIGRTVEITTIHRLLLEFGTSRFLFISGEGGIGKTRLLEEIRDQIRTGHLEPSDLYANHRIALVRQFTDSKWDHEFMRGAHAMAHDLGVTLDLTDAEYDPNRMAEQLATQIVSRPSAIIVCLGSYPQIEAQLRRALDLKIPVLTFDNHLRSIEGDAIKVFQEDLNGQQLVTSLMLQEINYRGEVAVVWAPDDPLQQRRRTDLDRLLHHYNLVKLVDVSCEMSKRSSERAAEQIRTHLALHPDTKAIWCVFDEFARGVVQALLELSRNDIKVYSFDLCPSDKELMLMEGSPWRATAAIDPVEAGRLLVRLALQQAITADLVPVEHYYSLPLELVTQESLRVSGETQWYWSHTDVVGWSSELRSIAAHRRIHNESLYILDDVIDFADPDLAVKGNLEQRLAEVTIHTALDTLALSLEQLDVQSRLLQTEATEQQRAQVHEKLVNAINERTRDQRLLLCFDTTEQADNDFLDQGLVDVLCALENVLVVFAGRPGTRMDALIGQITRQKISNSEIVQLGLDPFDLASSHTYLSEKQRIMPLQLSDDLAYTLATLALGKPILLDLAVEYVFRDIPLNSLLDRIRLEVMSQEQIEDAARSFERGLVQYISQLRNQIDRLVLRLSLIAPLSVEAIATLFQISQEDAIKLFEEAKTYAFIRVVYRHGGTEIELHDEMHRLVTTYLWTMLDPNGNQRRQEHRWAVEFYRQQDNLLNRQIKQYATQIGDLEHQISALKAQPSLDQMSHDTLRARKLRLEIERSAIRNRRHAVTKSWVVHMFEGGSEQAFEEWMRLVDKVRAGMHFSFVWQLCQCVAKYVPNFTNDQNYAYKFRCARSLLDIGKIDESVQLFEIILQGAARNHPDRRSNIYNMLGVAYLRLGRPASARDYQQRCLKLIALDDKRARVFVLNQIGYCYRLQDDESPRYGKAAQKCFEAVIELATEAQDEVTGLEQRKLLRLIASTNNNLGYLYGLNRNYDRAETLINRAITIWKEMDEESESARAETALGILARDRGYYDLSRRHLERAITLLPQVDKSDMHIQAYFQLGWTEWFDAVDRTDKVNLDGLHLAVRLLRRSLELAQEQENRRSQPGILHQLASVIWRLGRETANSDRCTEARALNQVALRLSNELDDHRYYIDSLLGEAEFDLDLDDDRHIAKYVSLLDVYERKKLSFPLYYGRMRRILAEFALRRGDKERGFDQYADGIALINEHGGFGPYTVEKELRHLVEYLRQLPRLEVEQYLQLMLVKWQDWTFKRHQHGLYDLVFWCQNEIQQTKLYVKA